MTDAATPDAREISDASIRAYAAVLIQDYAADLDYLDLAEHMAIEDSIGGVLLTDLDGPEIDDLQRRILDAAHSAEIASSWPDEQQPAEATGGEQAQPWPRAQRMPLAVVGDRPQPWHYQAIAEYGAATGTELEPNPTIPGGYTATQVNWAITWWNERAEAEQPQGGAAEEVRTFLDALPGRIDIVADWTHNGVRTVLTAEALRAVLMWLADRNEQLRDQRDTARAEVARAWEDLTGVREERDALAARLDDLEGRSR